jgi:pentatricopeptide repeat protein
LLLADLLPVSGFSLISLHWAATNRKNMPFADAKAHGIDISALQKKKKVRDALELFQDMKNRGIEPTVIPYTQVNNISGHSRQTYNAAISACRKGGEWEEALKLLGDMEQKGIPPDVMTYNAAISACEKGKQWEEALRLLGDMKQKGIPPDATTYNAAISACGKGGQWEEAMRLLGDMDLLTHLPVPAFASRRHWPSTSPSTPRLT